MRRNKTPNYGTFQIAKSGAPSKMISTGHFSADQAEENCRYLESVNPGKKWVVLPVGVAQPQGERAR